MALHALRQDNVPIAALLTTVTETYDRISMHGVCRELLVQQAQSIGLPLHQVRIPPQCVNPIYEARMEEALRIHYDAGVRTVAFGDIFLEDLRVYREKNLARIAMTALFPIWKRDTRELIRSFHAAGFRAITACVDPKVLDRSFAGSRARCLVFSRLARRRRSLRRKRRIPHLCLRRPHFPQTSSGKAWRSGRARLLHLLRPAPGGIFCGGAALLRPSAAST